MCGRFFLKITGQAFETLVGESFDEIPAKLTPRFNIAPTQDVPVARREKGGKLKLADARWGLIPHWSKDQTIAARTINARSETAHEKPAFRDAFKSHRCLIAADGFYEWKAPELKGAKKQPVAVQTVDNNGEVRPFVMAGLWSRWRDPRPGPEGPPLDTFTILTCEANDLIRGIHDRMPVILPDPQAAQAWLDDGTTVDDARALCKPLPAGRMAWHPVSLKVNSVKNDTPDLPEPVEPELQSLFG